VSLSPCSSKEMLIGLSGGGDGEADGCPIIKMSGFRNGNC